MSTFISDKMDKQVQQKKKKQTKQNSEEQIYIYIYVKKCQRSAEMKACVLPQHKETKLCSNLVTDRFV